MGGNATYQVDLFGRIRRSIEAARADEEEVASIRDTVKVTVAADVARAYVGVCAAHEAEDLAVRSIAIEQRLLDINRRMARAGRSAAPMSPPERPASPRRRPRFRPIAPPRAPRSIALPR
jgi:outer membrane protein TolC